MSSVHSPRMVTGAFVAVALAFTGAVAAGRPGGSSRPARSAATSRDATSGVQVGPRPAYLVHDMDEGPLKKELRACSARPPRPTEFSIAHRGATPEFPEETAESMEAAARQGAGIIECDVTFTRDRQLVCRHSQCDLHTTTNILAVPSLAAKCTTPFSPADPSTGRKATAMCCTSDITLAEFASLCGKREGHDPDARTPEQYLGAPPNGDRHPACPRTMSHDGYIDLVNRLGRSFTPELKAPKVTMPFEGTYSQREFSQQMIDAYKLRHIDARRVFVQSFDYRDILYFIANEPEFGAQAVFLDGRVDEPGGLDTAIASMQDVARAGVRIIAPPVWALVTIDGSNHIVPSAYAKAAKAAGLDIITWTLERSGPLATVGRTDYYHQSITPAVHRDGDTFVLLDVLARQVGVRGVFSDSPGTVTYYANCVGR